jgi:N-ethylmaleimide reductase
LLRIFQKQGLFCPCFFCAAYYFNSVFLTERLIMPTLFDPIQFGAIAAANRVIMAPLTRSRAGASRIPNDLMVEYYRQRAGAGLIISEATAISKMGFGWYGAPAMYNDDHVAGWKKVTDAVHQAGGKIVMQMWHMGRVSHPDNLDGETPVAPSAIAAEGTSSTPNGRLPYVIPRAMTLTEIKSTVADYVAGARRAMDAGFDGVEIHGAHGYLLDQFIRDSSNQRTDEYGGSIENRLRFPLEVVMAVAKEIGADKTGIRISPTSDHNSMADSTAVETFTQLVKKLDALDLAFLHVREDLPQTDAARAAYVTPHLRPAYHGNMIVNGGYELKDAEAALASGLTDSVAFGRAFIANPDLVQRFQKHLALNPLQDKGLYAGGPEGYTDYKTA